MKHTYSPQTVTQFAKLAQEDHELARRSASVWFDMGKIIWEKVLQRQRGAKHEGQMKQFQADLQKQGVKLSVQTLHNRKHFFLGARDKRNLAYILPTDYWIGIGEICADESLICTAYAHALRRQVFTDGGGDPDLHMLDEVGKLIGATLEKLKWNPTVAELVSRGLIDDPQSQNEIPIDAFKTYDHRPKKGSVPLMPRTWALVPAYFAPAPGKRIKSVDDLTKFYVLPGAVVLHVISSTKDARVKPFTVDEIAKLSGTLDALMELDHQIKLIVKSNFSCVCLAGCSAFTQQQYSHRLIGRDLIILTGSDEYGGVREPSEKEMAKSDKVATIIRENRRKAHVAEILGTATPAAKKAAKDKVFFGKSQEVLLDRSKFPEGSVDVCITDPPYSDDYNPSTLVAHDKLDTPEECAELAAEVARIILKRKINKEQFAWFEFCPLDAVHIFAPPLIKVFKEHNPNFHYQLLIWNKEGVQPVGGDELFAMDAEAILFCSTGRTLGGQRDGEVAGAQRRIFNHKIDKSKFKFWKPPALLKELITISMYGERNDPAARRQIVLDPFAGRGSLAVAARLAKRDYRLIECNEKQYKAALAAATAAEK